MYSVIASSVLSPAHKFAQIAEGRISSRSPELDNHIKRFIAQLEDVSPGCIIAHFHAS
jgi:hypothetical protein